jgi:hypothetical protein
MSSRSKLLLRRAAIVIAVFGTGIAAFVLVLVKSDQDDPLRRPGEACIYLGTGKQFCGDRAEEFCAREEVVRAERQDGATRTCVRIRREGAGG